MDFKFESTGKIIYGMPYVAKITLDVDSTLKKEFIECKADITTDGEVNVKAEYEANTFDIIEERLASCCPDVLASYSIAYRGKLITLGEVGCLEIEEKIKMFLEKEITIGVLLNSIDEMIRERFEDEINEILNSQKETIFTDKKNYINILSSLKTFLKDNEYMILQFSDFHVIFESECEKIMMKFIDDNNVYIECQNFKINIMLNKIENYECMNSKFDYSRINIYMQDGATISLIKSN